MLDDVEPDATPYSPGDDGLPRMWLTHTALGLERVEVPESEDGNEKRPYSPGQDGLPRLWLTETALELERVNARGEAETLTPDHIAAAVLAAKRKTAVARRPAMRPLIAAFLLGAALATLVTVLIMRA